MANKYAYAGKILRVDLTNRRITEEVVPDDIQRKYLGGVGIGAYYLYKEVMPGVEWSDPRNRVVIATGPVTGTAMGGTGGYVVVTKGALTNGASDTEANGFLGAYLKFCGYDAIILEGKANKLSYLHVHDGGAEIKDASHLAGKDTWEVEKRIKEELGMARRQMSVCSIGVAGEKLVRFACLAGDEGHVASHNGVGAVLGSKNLKAIAVARGKHEVALSDKERFSRVAKEVFDKTSELDAGLHYKFGTLGTTKKAQLRMLTGRLPVRNYTTSIFADGEKISEEYMQALPDIKLQRNSCWACRFRHCQLMEVVQGPFAGFSGEEPEYEVLAAFSSLIGNGDMVGGSVLANEADRLGIDGNETGWVVAWVMECYEKGLIDKSTTDGLEMTWGNLDAVKALLNKIANREGFGNILAEGAMRAAAHLGGEAQKLAVYTKRGNTPRMHDHRSFWSMLLDTVTSETGTDVDGPLVFVPEQVGLPHETDLFSPSGAVAVLAKVRSQHILSDSLIICMLNTIAVPKELLADVVSAATGWNFTVAEGGQIAMRVFNLLRAFNIRHGHIKERDWPSPRYGSAPVDGPNKGRTILPVWTETLDRYYESMGWDVKTGKPRPETLVGLGLEGVAHDLWH